MSTSRDPVVHNIRPEDNRVGPRAGVTLIVVFLLAISLPGVVREFSPDAIRGTVAQISQSQNGAVVDRLRAVEKRIDEGAWTQPIRQQMQTALYRVFREGNRKVVVGTDGWLFHRPGIRALTGRGPVLGPTHSVAKDHSLKHWEGPIPVIKDFAAQLEERGIKLLLVPVPDKAAVMGHRLKMRGDFSKKSMVEEFADWVTSEVARASPSPSSASPPGPLRLSILAQLARWKRFLARGREALSADPLLRGGGFDSKWAHPNRVQLDHILRESGLAVERLHPEEINNGGYWQRDTHMIPHGMLSGGMRITQAPPLDKLNRSTTGPRAKLNDDASVAGVGDLVGALGVDSSPADLGMEAGTAQVTTPALSDPASPIVLLGDSNVNMYDDPGLPFYLPGAGLGSWLSAYLGKPLHLIAINGGGATQVRQRFAALPDDVVRAKKVVIWVIAERDLFMDPAVARENGVEWKRVSFNPNQSPSSAATPGDAIVVDATLTAKSKLEDPRASPYEDAVYAAEFSVDTVISGSYTENDGVVVLWNFRKRTVQPSARYPIGQKLRLTLVPWLSLGDLTKTNLSDDFQRFDVPLFYAEKAEPIGN